MMIVKISENEKRFIKQGYNGPWICSTKVELLPLLLCYNHTMDVTKTNSAAWDKEVEKNNWWTRIVDESKIKNAKNGDPEIWVAPTKDIPLSWAKPLKGKKVLNACGGGGQQTPILASYGAAVTVIDISPNQLRQDRLALEHFNLEGEIVEGSVLSLPFEDNSFDHIINPCSLNFIEDLGQVYSEFHRVLKKGGSLIFGISNPILYIFDDKKIEKNLKVKYTLPFSDTKSLSKRELEKRIKKGDTIEFSHTLSSIISDLLSKGFIIDGFYSDYSGFEPLDSFVRDSYLAFKAIKVF